MGPGRPVGQEAQAWLQPRAGSRAALLRSGLASSCRAATWPYSSALSRRAWFLQHKSAQDTGFSHWCKGEMGGKYERRCFSFFFTLVFKAGLRDSTVPCHSRHLLAKSPGDHLFWSVACQGQLTTAREPGTWRWGLRTYICTVQCPGLVGVKRG